MQHSHIPKGCDKRKARGITPTLLNRPVGQSFVLYLLFWPSHNRQRVHSTTRTP